MGTLLLTPSATMHTRICLLCLFAAGCGSSAPPGAPTGGAKPSGPPKNSRAATSMVHAGRAARAVAPEGPAPNATAAPGDPLPADLRTRASGSDWPGFLGPTGDGVSSEKGIIAPSTKEGLRIVWQRRLVESYAMPSISRGRLFVFDRVRDSARLTCLKSETGEEIWTFEYPTFFQDNYGYNGGPRCCPVVNGDRVYIFGPEGMLHCLKSADGKLVWKVDTAKDFGVINRFFGVGSSPVIEGELLLVQVGGSPEGSENVATTALKPNGTALVA